MGQHPNEKMVSSSDNPPSETSLANAFKQHSLPAFLTAFMTTPLRGLMNRSIEHKSLFSVMADRRILKGIPLNTLRGGLAVTTQSWIKDKVQAKFDNPQSNKAQLTALFAAALGSTPITAFLEAPYIRLTNQARPHQVAHFPFIRQPSAGKMPFFRYPYPAAPAFFCRDLKFIFTIHFGKDLPTEYFIPSLIFMSASSGFCHNLGLRAIKQDLNLPQDGTQPNFKKDGVLGTLKKIGQGAYTHALCQGPIKKSAEKMSSLDLLRNILSVCCGTNMVFWRTVFIAAFYNTHQLSKWAINEAHSPAFFKPAQQLPQLSLEDPEVYHLTRNPL